MQDNSEEIILDEVGRIEAHASGNENQKVLIILDHNRESEEDQDTKAFHWHRLHAQRQRHGEG